jgi:hypothetical protein
MRAYFDADVVIWLLRDHPAARALFDRLAEQTDVELWMCAMQRAEIVLHMRPGEETLTFDFLSLFRTHPVTEEIVDLAGTYFRQWRHSHGIDENDAILAATVSLTGGRIVTLNVKHYPMPGVAVERAWD